MADLVANVRELATRKDQFTVNANRIEAVGTGGEAQLRFKLNKGSTETTSFRLCPVAHENLQELCDIGRYYRNLLSLPSKELWALNVNQWLPKVSRRTVRIYDGDYADHLGMRSIGSVRCLKSSHYRVLDNEDLLTALLPQFEKRGLQVLTSNLSERHMVIKAVSPKMVSDVPEIGDRVQAGIAVGNSEVGEGSLWITEFDYVLSCTNGMVGVKESKWSHRSGKSGDEDTQFNRYSKDTQEKTNDAFWSQVTDDIDHIFDEDRFAVRLKRYGNAAGDVISHDQEEGVIRVVCSNFGIPRGDVDKVLRHYHRGNQENRWGVAQAVTRYAQEDVSDFDFSTDLEAAGRKIVDGALLV